MHHVSRTGVWSFVMFALEEPPAVVHEVPPPEKAANTTITVTAPPVESPKIRAREFLQQVLPASTMSQYPGWTKPVCVKVYGLDPALEARVRTRVEAVAADAGAEVAERPCRPNIGIIFSSNGQQQIVELRKKRGRLLAHLPPQEIEALRKDRHPVVWWRTPAGFENGGAGTGSAGLMSAPGAQALMNALPGAVASSRESGGSALISTRFALSVSAAVAIVDVQMAEGKSLDSVADFVAMVTLGPIRFPADPTGVPSILDLFAQDGEAKELSSWDRSLLSAYMDVLLDRTARWQRNRMRNAITRDQEELAESGK
jgi:hypothetical protein